MFAKPSLFSAPAGDLPAGKGDVLLRFFEAQPSAFIHLAYLHKALESKGNSTGLIDFLCNRLFTLDLEESGLEQYLSQVCQLVVSKPRSPLERVLVDLCARSLRIAVKVCWLLLAVCQDNPKDRYVQELRDRCERSALEGHWDPPFRELQLLSPPRRSFVNSPPVQSPSVSPVRRRGSAGRPSAEALPNGPSRRFGSPEPLAHTRSAPDVPSRPTSPDGLGGGLHSSYTMGQGLEGLLCSSPPERSDSRAAHQGSLALTAEQLAAAAERAERRLRLRAHSSRDHRTFAALQENGAAGALALVTPLKSRASYELSPPSSPRLRQTIFSATLDFIEALCDASSGLTAFAVEDREWALKRGLDEINKEVEKATAGGVACWFPMGARDERIVRLAGKEAHLLNSREKAPFMLLVEVVSADEPGAHDSVSGLEHAGQGTSASQPLPARASPTSPLSEGLLSPGQPPSVASAASTEPDGPHPGSSVFASQEEPVRQSGVEPEVGSAAGEWISRAAGSLDPLEPPREPEPKPPWWGSLLGTPSSTSSPTSPATGAEQAPGSLSSRGRAGEKAATPGLAKRLLRPGVSLRGPQVQPEDAPLLEQPARVGAGRERDGAAETVRGLDAALAGLRGAGPLVSVALHVLKDTVDSPAPGQAPASAPEPLSAAEPASSSLRESGSSARALSLLCSWGKFRTKGDGPGPRATCPPYVRLELKVHGGVDLRLSVKSPATHRRVPSDEALLRMAALQHAQLPALHRGLPSAGHLPAPAAASAPLAEGQGGAGLGPGHAEEGPGPADEGGRAELARQARGVYGEPWGQRSRRVRRESLHGHRPGWALRPVIVKSGDDCRQELMAAQLIQLFADIFAEAGLPPGLRPYEVLVTSSRTALIEVVPDALSIHTIKARSPPGTTLAGHFFAVHGRGAPGCLQAQRRFAESLAAYSLVCYFLQIKDRHNGNILLDLEGRVVHIDFGFMLSNSPGGVNFEAAPFKLTREFLEVMDSNPDGAPSEIFDYYKVLTIQGFLAARKQADRVVLLVEMMAGSGCPAFKAGPRAVHQLRRRFHLGTPEPQCVDVVLSLIAESLDAWRTRQYDYYQRVLNGIL